MIIHESLHVSKDSRGFCDSSRGFCPDIIISGGQTGADRGALNGALALGIPTGGYAPQGWKTESGACQELGSVYGLIENTSPDYNMRTRVNMEMCDAVIVVARNFDSAGTKWTLEVAFKRCKPLFKVNYPARWPLDTVSLVGDIQSWLCQIRPCVLNVAGNRESKAPGIEEWTCRLIQKIFCDCVSK